MLGKSSWLHCIKIFESIKHVNLTSQFDFSPTYAIDIIPLTVTVSKISLRGFLHN